MELIESFKKKASQHNKRIVLPESNDERILQAAKKITESDIAEVILIGQEAKIKKEIEKDCLTRIIIKDSAENSQEKEELAELLYELRHHKGISKEKARDITSDPLYYATLLVASGRADGMVAGADNPTGKVLRPALQTIKTKAEISIVSGAFIMILDKKNFGDKGVLVMSDCAVNPQVDAKGLAEIAVSTARTSKKLLNIEPKVALLSFSTRGSASHSLVDKVQEATALAQKIAPEFAIDGEMQADAALVEAVAKKKAPDSQVGGKANVLIYPDLQSGNIGYKLTQRLAGAEAVGPILQGMDRPVNDLSRGCSVEDIVNLTAITVLQAL